MDGLSSYTMTLTWPIAKTPTELFLPDPCSPQGLQTTGMAPKGPHPPLRGTSYATVFLELWLQHWVSRGRGRFEP